MQLWDREERTIEEAARRLADLDISVIDLNFGCPKKRIMGTHAAGATLLRDPATIGRLVAAAVRGAGAVPVTAKIRLGPSLASRTAPAVARSAEANGAAAITVHGRTADESYGTPCDRAMIAEVVRRCGCRSSPTATSRCRLGARHAARHRRGRRHGGARRADPPLGVPRDRRGAARRGRFPRRRRWRTNERCCCATMRRWSSSEGDHWGTVVMRKFAVRYLTGIPGSRPFRDRITRAENAAEFRRTVDDFFPDGRLAILAPAPGSLAEPICGAA